MGRMLGLVLVLGVAVGGLGWVFKGLDGQVKRLKFESERITLKEKFGARIPSLIQSDDEHAAYDLVASVKKYAGELADLYKKYPEFRDPDAALKRFEQDYKDKKIDENKMRGIRERVALVKSVWERFIKADYKPVATARDKSLRMDIYDVRKKAADGEDKLFVNVVYVGMVPDKTMTYGGITMDIPLEDDEATAKKRKAGQLKDNKAERKAQVNGGGEPNTLVVEPDRWVEDFPPGIGIGYYNFPMFPGEAKSLDLAFNFEIKNAGGGHVVNDLKYKLPIQAEWKLPHGASYGADEQATAGDD